MAAGDGARAAFGAWLLLDGGGEAFGVFSGGAGAPARLLTTSAPVAALANTTVSGVLCPVRDAIHAKADGRTLIHVGLKETRRPEATLGALLLVR